MHCIARGIGRVVHVTVYRDYPRNNMFFVVFRLRAGDREIGRSISFDQADVDRAERKDASRSSRHAIPRP